MSEFADMSDPAGDDLRDRVERLLAEHDPAQCSETEFLRAQFDAGLAWVHFPEGLGGAGVARSRQNEVDAMLAAAGAPGPAKTRNAIGLGMAAPVIVAFGTPEQQQKYLRPLFTGEEIWCQLFSEPGAGSDLAAVATRAVREGDSWTVDGQKVWTSGAHQARRAILVARTDTSVPKHRGLTYFLLDMHQSGVDVRPLRQITGEAEFNEVYLDGVTVPDSDRLGEVGEGWKVATATLNSERVAIGAGLEREAGQIGIAARRWREHPEVRTPGAHDELMSWWVQSEALRLAGTRLGQLLAVGAPGPESSAMKLAFAYQAQQISAFALELDPADSLVYDDWTMVRSVEASFVGRGPGFRYLRAKGNSIEGGTSEIMRNIIAERVLGLPAEARLDKDVPFSEVPR